MHASTTPVNIELQPIYLPFEQFIQQNNTTALNDILSLDYKEFKRKHNNVGVDEQTFDDCKHKISDIMENIMSYDLESFNEALKKIFNLKVNVFKQDDLEKYQKNFKNVLNFIMMTNDHQAIQEYYEHCLKECFVTPNINKYTVFIQGTCAGYPTYQDVQYENFNKKISDLNALYNKTKHPSTYNNPSLASYTVTRYKEYQNITNPDTKIFRDGYNIQVFSEDVVKALEEITDSNSQIPQFKLFDEQELFAIYRIQPMFVTLNMAIDINNKDAIYDAQKNINAQLNQNIKDTNQYQFFKDNIEGFKIWYKHKIKNLKLAQIFNKAMDDAVKNFTSPQDKILDYIQVNKEAGVDVFNNQQECNHKLNTLINRLKYEYRPNFAKINQAMGLEVFKTQEKCNAKNDYFISLQYFEEVYDTTHDYKIFNSISAWNSSIPFHKYITNRFNFDRTFSYEEFSVLKRIDNIKQAFAKQPNQNYQDFQAANKSLELTETEFNKYQRLYKLQGVLASIPSFKNYQEFNTAAQTVLQINNDLLDEKTFNSYYKDLNILLDPNDTRIDKAFNDLNMFFDNIECFLLSVAFCCWITYTIGPLMPLTLVGVTVGIIMVIFIGFIISSFVNKSEEKAVMSDKKVFALFKDNSNAKGNNTEYSIGLKEYTKDCTYLDIAAFCLPQGLHHEVVVKNQTTEKTTWVDKITQWVDNKKSDKCGDKNKDQCLGQNTYQQMSKERLSQKSNGIAC